MPVRPLNRKAKGGSLELSNFRVYPKPQALDLLNTAAKTKKAGFWVTVNTRHRPLSHSNARPSGLAPPTALTKAVVKIQAYDVESPATCWPTLTPTLISGWLMTCAGGCSRCHVLPFHRATSGSIEPPRCSHGGVYHVPVA
jgi:hypothetical protein